MVPNGWREGRVRDLIKSLNAGVSVNSEDDGNLSSSYKILKTSCVSKGIFDPNKTKSVVEDVEISRLKEPVLCDSIIISRMNTPALVGANGYIENGIENTYLPDRLWQAKPKSNDVIMKWLGYWFASSHTRYTLSSTATGTSGSMKNITKSDVLNIKIDIPPLPEQRKIATILGTWDKAISTTERLIDNSKQQKKALMQQLLTGKKRLLDNSGKPFEGEWEEVKFGDCINHFGGTALEKHVSEDATHHFISIGNYSMDGKYVDKGQRVALNEKTSAKLLQKGELVMVLNDKTKTGDIIGSTILIDEDNKYIYNQRSERIIPKEDIHITFFWFLLNSSKFRAEVFNRSQGGTQIYINFGSVKTIHLNLPSKLEQQKIAAVLNNANKEIHLLEQQLADLKQEKKALMQQLLTGKRRVTV